MRAVFALFHIAIHTHLRIAHFPISKFFIRYQVVVFVDHHFSPPYAQVGNCVGFGNYKFFVLLLIWGLAATLTTVLAWAPLFLGLWSPVRPAYPLPHHARFLAEAVRFLPAAVPGGDVAGGGGGIGIDDKIAQANAEFTFRHANTSRVSVCVRALMTHIIKLARALRHVQ